MQSIQSKSFKFLNGQFLVLSRGIRVHGQSMPVSQESTALSELVQVGDRVPAQGLVQAQSLVIADGVGKRRMRSKIAAGHQQGILHFCFDWFSLCTQIVQQL